MLSRAESVTHTFINHDDDLLDLTVRTPSGDKVIRTTDHHPFWDVTRQAWVDAASLPVGDRLATSTDAAGESGSVTVVSGATVPGTGTRYNLTVETLHTYYVLAGTTPVLVHNCPGGEEVESAASAATGQNATESGARLSLDRIKITSNGVDAVERHLGRFPDAGAGLDAAEAGMVGRLRSIAGGDLAPTAQDVRFYSHELRESVLYRKAGYLTGQPAGDAGYDLWDTLHTQALADYGFPRKIAPDFLYYPSVLSGR